MQKKIFFTIGILLIVILSTILFVITNNNNKVQNGSPQQSNNNEVSSNTDTHTGVATSNDSTTTMVFGGDVLLSESMINAYNRNNQNVNNIMSESLLDEFKNADIAMINQEFPFSLRGTKMQDKQYTFKADPSYVKIFQELGIDIVSLANNHILDFGTDAMLDTLDTLNDASIIYGGAGKDLTEAKEIKYIENKGKKIAFLCASRVIPVTSWNATDSSPGLFTTYDSSGMIEQLKVAENDADISVVYVHWGLEHKEMPEDYQRNMAKQYIDAGADVVIGCHTHCLQGMEIYNNKPIVYSMGNFLFGGNIDRTMMLKILLDNNIIKTQIIPCNAKSYKTSTLDDETQINNFYEYYRNISFDINIDDDGYVTSQ